MSYFNIGVMILSAIVSARAAYNQTKANQAIANNNAVIAENQAQDATKRGEQDAQKAMRDARQLAAAQRASYSARGVDISDGTAADVIEQTDFFGQTDAATARTNAAKEAWNYRARKTGYEIERNANNPNNAAATSLLSSAGSVAASWYGRK